METKKYEFTEKDKNDERPSHRQLYLGLVGVILNVLLGLTFGATTVTVPQLRHEANSTEAVSDNMVSWLSSIVPYTGLIWMVALTVLADFFGRKKILIFVGANCLVAFAFLYFSKNVWHVFVCQFLQGTTQGSMTTVLIMSLSECTSPKYRGLFVSLNSATFYWGIWIANALGIFFHYSYIGLIGIVLSIYVVVSLTLLPESPLWLAWKGRYEESAAAHRWFKGKDVESEKELEEMIRNQEELNQCKKEKKSVTANMKHYAKVVRQSEFYKPLLLCSLVSCVYNFSGKITCAIYAVEIMKKITTSTTEAYSAVLILDGFSVAGTYVGCVLMKRFKRRTMIIRPGMGCVLFLMLLSIYLYLVKLNVVFENVYISCVLLIAYSVAACCGPLIIATAINADLYPVKNRSFAISTICFVANIIYGTLMKSGPFIFQTFEMHGTFLFFAITLSITLILTYKYLPETKDKSIHEISGYFAPKNRDAVMESKLLESGNTKEHTT